MCVYGASEGGGGGGQDLKRRLPPARASTSACRPALAAPLGRAFLPPSGRHRIPVLPLLACFVLRRFLIFFVHRQKPQSTTFRAFIFLPRGPFKRRRAPPFAPLAFPLLKAPSFGCAGEHS